MRLGLFHGPRTELNTGETQGQLIRHKKMQSTGLPKHAYQHAGEVSITAILSGKGVRHQDWCLKGRESSLNLTHSLDLSTSGSRDVFSEAWMRGSCVTIISLGKAEW